MTNKELLKHMVYSHLHNAIEEKRNGHFVISSDYFILLMKKIAEMLEVEE
jgi:hypothetical protein